MNKCTINIYVWLMISFLIPLNLDCKVTTKSSSKSKKFTTTKSKNSVKEISAKSDIDTSKHSVLKFHSQSCGACIMFKKTYEKLASQYPDIQFLKVDGLKNLDLLQEHNIKAFPSFVFIDGNTGKPVETVVGAHKDKVIKALKKLSKSKKPSKLSGGKTSSAKNKKTSSKKTVLTVSSLAELENLIKKNKKLVVAEYHAEAWCGACKMFAPAFAKLADDHGDVAIFVKVDDMQAGNKAIAAKHGVTGLPTTLVFKDGKTDKPVEKVIGADKNKVAAAIKKHATKTTENTKSSSTSKTTTSPAKVAPANKTTTSKPSSKKSAPAKKKSSTSKDVATGIIDIKSKKHLEDVIQKSSIPVVVDYHAESWCGACKMYKGIFAGFPSSHPKIQFAKADHDVAPNQAIAQDYQVKAFPTTLVFEGGKKTKSIVGINIGELNKTFKALESAA
jgi:thioredoxin 1